MSLSRRHFLTRSGWFAASALSLPACTPSIKAVEPTPSQRPRHIIHLVCDGMSSGTLTGADHLSHLTRKRGLTWLQLQQRPDTVTALVDMRSLNSLVTDSAAAASSWGSGSRVKNGMLNVLPDGRNLHTLYHLFSEAGWRRGLVTTTEITHATPAGFAATGGREAAEDIARQYLERKIDVLMGGGQQFFDAAKRKDKRNLRAEFRQQGYTVMQTLSDLNAATTDRPWLGIFAPSHLPYSLDHLASPEDLKKIPSLAYMTRGALAHLGRSPHFILQVEGGRVDHGAHSCDAAAAFHDLIAFDEALDVCLDFQQKEPDTLLLVTTDHGTGNPGLNGMGDAYASSSTLFANLVQIKKSFAAMNKYLEPGVSPRFLREVFTEMTGYRPPKTKVKMLAEFLEKKGRTLYDSMNSVTAQVGQILANYTGIGWTSGAHTADYVPLLAAGPGADRFRGFLQNTDIFKHYLALTNIDYCNPSVPLLAETRPSASEAELLAA